MCVRVTATLGEAQLEISRFLKKECGGTSSYINRFKPCGNYMYHLIQELVMLHFDFIGFV
jgi:hypothetical protein